MRHLRAVIGHEGSNELFGRALAVSGHVVLDQRWGGIDPAVERRDTRLGVSNWMALVIDFNLYRVLAIAESALLPAAHPVDRITVSQASETFGEARR